MENPPPKSQEEHPPVPDTNPSSQAEYPSSPLPQRYDDYQEPYKLLTKNGTLDTFLGVITPFALPILLSAIGFASRSSSSWVYGAFNFVPLMLSFVLFLVTKDRYPDYARGLKGALFVVAILFGISVLFVLGALAVCLFAATKR